MELTKFSLDTSEERYKKNRPRQNTEPVTCTLKGYPQTLISTSTPEGSSSFMRASTVFALDSSISMRRT